MDCQEGIMSTRQVPFRRVDLRRNDGRHATPLTRMEQWDILLPFLWFI